MEKNLVQAGLYFGTLSTALFTYNVLNKKTDNNNVKIKIKNTKVDKNKNFCYRIYIK